MSIGTFKRVVKSMAAQPLGWALSRRPIRPGCVVLIYHRVGVDDDAFPNLNVASFQAQMEWLTRNCNVIAPEDLRARVSHARNGLPSRPDVLVTFDDGYRDYYDHAYPVLARCGIRAVNFLCTRFVDDASLIGWWDRLYLAVEATTRAEASLPWVPEPFTLDRRGRAALLAAAKDYIKQQPDANKDSVTQSVVDRLDVDETVLRVGRQTMSWEEVRRAADFTCYGGHTHNHRIVSRVESDALEDEIRTCRDRIAAETGEAPKTFAYPNGRAIDFTEEAKSLLTRYGFDTAFCSISGINSVDTDWMEVRRISGGTSVADLAWRLSRMFM
jgi:peptidoglycan/xylan/chitin deacetylase (PgdA/CDA1 family)